MPGETREWRGLYSRSIALYAGGALSIAGVTSELVPACRSGTPTVDPLERRSLALNLALELRLADLF
jgi:hypothetical protein